MSRERRRNRDLIDPKALAAQIAMIRDECHEAVKILSNPNSLSDADLAECLRLSDSLDVTNRFLKSAVAHVAIARRKTRGLEIEF